MDVVARLSLTLLGGFSMRSETGPAMELGARKARALLAYLAMQPGHLVSRDKIAALLWEDKPEAQARGSLRNTLSALRKDPDMADSFLIKGNLLAIAPAAVEVDALSFGRLVATGTNSALEKAVGLYQGELLEGFDPRAPAFEDWLMAERGRLHEQALGALTALLDIHLAAHENKPAIHLALRLLKLDPMRESAHRALMILYARQNRYSTAFRQYRSCQTVLHQQLGLAPEPATEALYRDLIHQRRRPALISTPAVAGLERQPEAIGGNSSSQAKRGRLVQPGTPKDAELRQVTVLVLQRDEGTVASPNTAMDEGEATSQRWESWLKEIENFRGLVVDRTASSLTAVFGLPAAFGNDAEHAVRAACAIRGWSRPETGSGTAATEPARIGIASGRLLVAPSSGAGLLISPGPEDILLETRRLAASATEGETLLSDAVHSSVARRVLASRRDDAAAPTAAATPLWRLRGWGAQPAQSHPVMVGRRQELRQLVGALHDCLATGSGQGFLIRGEAGVGKTRLIEELITLAAANDFSVHLAQVLDFGTATGQEAIRTLARSLLALSPECGSEQALATAEGVLGEAAAELEHHAFLADLLDLPQRPESSPTASDMDSAERRRGLRALLAWLLESLSQKQPQLLIVEDVHWADTATLISLAALAATAQECPALVVLTARVEGQPLDPAWRGALQSAPLTTLDLGPLREEEALTLIRALGSPDNLRTRRCLDRARGNPLFLEQLLRAECDAGIPDTVQALVWARLDRLPANHREPLQAASVLGQHFELAVLRQLIGDPLYDCATLLEQRFVRPGIERYRFVHALIMEGIYESIPPARRRVWHQRAADCFRGRDEILRAEHLERAQDPSAAEAYLAAARLHMHRLDRALGLVQRGLLLECAPSVEFELGCLHGELLRSAGRTKAAIDEFEHALHLAVDSTRRCRALIGLATSLSVEDRNQEALEALDRAEPLAQQLGDAAELAEIYHQRGNILFPQGELERCLEQHERARGYAREAACSSLEASALSGLGDAWYQRGQMRTAFTYFDRCIVLCRKHSLGRIEVINLPMRSAVRFFLNDLPGSLEDGRKGLELASKNGYQRAELLTHLVLAETLIETDKWQAALEQAEKGLILARRLGSPRFEAESLCDLAEALAAAGERPRAEQLLKTAFAISRDCGPSYNGAWIAGVLALVTADPRKREWALDQGEAILGGSCVSHSYLYFYQRAISACLKAGAWERAQHYAEALEQYTRPERLPWSDFYIARGRALAAHGKGDRGPELLTSLSRLQHEAAQLGLKAALPALDKAIEDW
jgi:DNA-binding SARP family transcriptional activator